MHRYGVSSWLFACLATLVFGNSPVLAADWVVTRASGEVHIERGALKAVSLRADEDVVPGDTVATGPTGRLLLTRGLETILVGPNTVLSLPREPQGEDKTTILQRAGRLLLDVEKKNVKHFSVETPFLAAVVKGTQFSVEVGRNETSVTVNRGVVEVLDFDTGEVGMVRPGQRAATRNRPGAGLSLSGAGELDAVRKVKPRASKAAVPAPAASAKVRAAAISRQHGHARITSTVGELEINVMAATNGLARNMRAQDGYGAGGRDGGGPGAESGRVDVTIWSPGNSAHGSSGTGGTGKAGGQSEGQDNNGGGANNGGPANAGASTAGSAGGSGGAAPGGAGIGNAGVGNPAANGGAANGANASAGGGNGNSGGNGKAAGKGKS